MTTRIGFEQGCIHCSFHRLYGALHRDNLMFRNRHDAAQQLIPHLEQYKHNDVVVVAVPRGAVPMAADLANHFGWPLGVVFVKKLGHPFNHEYAIGAVGLDDVFLDPGHTDVTPRDLQDAVAEAQVLLRRRRAMFLGVRPDVPLRGRTVLLVDDGIATGATVRASIAVLRKQDPAAIIVVAPVGSTSAIEELLSSADDVVVVHSDPNFRAVGEYYDDFSEVTDEDVVQVLQQI
ncbi:MAG: phosphoribosyltransferase [Candidatus Kapaibacteriota bacterium]